MYTRQRVKTALVWTYPHRFKKLGKLTFSSTVALVTVNTTVERHHFDWKNDLSLNRLTKRDSFCSQIL